MLPRKFWISRPIEIVSDAILESLQMLTILDYCLFDFT